MKKPKFNPKQYQKLTTSQKLNAMVRRAVQPVLEEREEEPTMRFSTAFIIVFLLQAFAIGGIVVFNHIHKNQQASQEIVEQSQPSETVSRVENPAPKAVAPAAAVVANREIHSRAENPAPKVEAVRHESRPVASAAVHHEATKAAPLAAAPRHSEGIRDSGKSYVVVKGDVLERIAKKFGVRYDDLLTLNKITNPRRLQIGRKLHVPVAHLAND